MPTQITHRTTPTCLAPNRARKPSPFLQLAEVRERHRRIRLGFRVPRRAACLTRRAMVAALREAEFNDWMNDGYDHANSMHQPIA